MGSESSRIAEIDSLSLQKAKPYQYGSLPSKNSIRLIRIEPPSNGKPLPRCSMITTQLGKLPQYYALSYTWGKPFAEEEEEADSTSARRNVPIWCNEQKLLITQNLFDALLQLQKRQESPFFWIDAMCINQEDLEERSQQVRIMGDIYKLATKVIVWLGKENSDSRAAMEIVSKMGPRLKIMTEARLSELNIYGVHDRRSYKILGTRVFYISDWRSFLRFLDRNWFNRVWTFQELVLAKDFELLCGNAILDGTWIDLLVFLAVGTRWISEIIITKISKFEGNLTPNPGSFIMERWMTQRTVREGGPLCPYFRSLLSEKSDISHPDQESFDFLAYVLYQTRSLQATDIKDHIFGIIGIASRYPGLLDVESPLTAPDYTKSEAQIYTELARVFITQTRSLAILSTVEDISVRVVEGLPSWVPDYSVHRPAALPIATSATSYNASGTAAAAVIDLPSESHILGISGYLIDVISAVGHSLDNPTADDIPYHEPNIQILSQLDPVYFNGQNRSEAFWRTLITNADGECYPARKELASSFLWTLAIGLVNWKSRYGLNDEASTSKIISLWHTLTTAYSASEIAELAIPSIQKIKQMAESCTRYVTDQREQTIPEDLERANALGGPWSVANERFSVNRRFFVTEKNLMGLGMKSVQVGDSVWVFPGAQVPFILRNQENGNFRFLGDAYIHGLMHREFTELNPSKLQKINLM